MAQPRRTSLAPWITASVAGVVLIALLLVFFFWLRPDEKDADRERAAAAPSTPGGLTTTERAAMNAAATEMINLLTFSRDSFAADFQRALDGTTGALRKDVQGKREKTLEAITKGKFDLFAKVSHKALSDTVTANGKQGYVVLVSVNGYRSTNPTVPIPQNLAVTVIDAGGGKWLAADVTYIGISA